jgi:hypothetical protein
VNASVRYAADLNSSSVLRTFALRMYAIENADENAPQSDESGYTSRVFVFLLGTAYGHQDGDIGEGRKGELRRTFQKHWRRSSRCQAGLRRALVRRCLELSHAGCDALKASGVGGLRAKRCQCHFNNKEVWTKPNRTESMCCTPPEHSLMMRAISLTCTPSNGIVFSGASIT